MINHFSICKDDDGIGLVYVVQMMGDTQNQFALFGGFGKNIHNAGFRGRVQAAGRFIHQKDRWVYNKFRSQFNSLEFPSRNRGYPLTSKRLYTHRLKGSIHMIFDFGRRCVRG